MYQIRIEQFDQIHSINYFLSLSAHLQAVHPKCNLILNTHLYLASLFLLFAASIFNAAYFRVANLISKLHWSKHGFRNFHF